MQIYIAGPLFNEGARWFNNKISALCEQHGLITFLPQRDGLLIKDGVDPKIIYQKDRDFLDKSKLVVACLNGIEVDSGAAWEIGYAAAKNIPIIALHTDSRSFSPFSKINPMLAYSAEFILNTLEDLDIYLARFVKNEHK